LDTNVVFHNFVLISSEKIKLLYLSPNRYLKVTVFMQENAPTFSCMFFKDIRFSLYHFF